MCKYCRDPSDVFLGRRVFGGSCDCECKEEDMVMGAIGKQCGKCGCIIKRRLK